MKIRKLYTALAAALCLAGCAGEQSGSTGAQSGSESSAPAGTEQQTGGEATEASGESQNEESSQPADGGMWSDDYNGVKVRLTTDKLSYEAGEEVSFELIIDNGREGYTITQTFIDYVCTGGLVETEELPQKLSSLKDGYATKVEGSFVSGRASEKSPKDHTAAGVESAVMRPYVKITYGGEEAMVRMIVTMNMIQKIEDIPTEYKVNYSQVSCHDPSIFRDTDGTYYVFGTHMGLASSKDLANWTDMTSSFRAGFTAETKEQIRAYNLDSSVRNWYDYLWAPDVIYNPVMEKYCMYLSANGDNWISNIVLLTADEAAGPYSYAGSIVYGGFTDDNVKDTDLFRVTGGSEIPERYITNGVKNKKWGDEYPNCIDPCVFYDEDGKLWMSYGSWSGGIFLLELDEETGLRDYSVKYKTDAHNDEYFGIKVAGGKYVSGEGSYIHHIGDYYYLFISYGNLEAKGGYNVRIYRSGNVAGPYVDELGNPALYDKYVMNYNQANGIRLFGGYKWRTSTTGQVAQGHNSVFTDVDSRSYTVFHTRTTNGSEGHYVKVHELFENEDGWLVAAPYQTNKSYEGDEVSAADMTGKYDFLVHTLDIDYKNLGVNTPDTIELGDDGSVTGAVEGTWSLEDGVFRLVTERRTYTGIAFRQYIEGTTLPTVCFTVLGTSDEITMWGSKKIN